MKHEALKTKKLSGVRCQPSARRSSLQATNYKLPATKGFTLIELLVVIAIIGLLSAIVVTNLNTARVKGADTAVKANLGNARSQAELYYDVKGNNYESVCSDDIIGARSIKESINAAKSASGISTATLHDSEGAARTATCNDTSDGWAAEVPLKSVNTRFWCVDSSGASKEETGTSLSVSTDVTCI